MFRCWRTGRASRKRLDLGVRATLSDIGQTVAENFGAKIAEGTSFLAVAILGSYATSHHGRQLEDVQDAGGDRRVFSRNSGRWWRTATHARS